jgi:hypothetical protein
MNQTLLSDRSGDNAAVVCPHFTGSSLAGHQVKESDMAQTMEIGKHRTSVYTEDGWTKVVYHSTCVIKWNDKEIILNSGGWRTLTTKARINQASNQFGLGIKVFQKNDEWFVTVPTDGGLTFNFEDNIKLNRVK